MKLMLLYIYVYTLHQNIELFHLNSPKIIVPVSKFKENFKKFCLKFPLFSQISHLRWNGDSNSQKSLNVSK